MKKYYRNNKGNSINVDENNLDKWIVIFNYNMYGVTGCENYIKR